MNYRSIIIRIVALPACAQDDIEKHRSCKLCGMDRKAFAYSRMLIVYADGSQTGLCSLNCAVTELKANPAKKVVTLLVADRNSHELLDVTKAYWVMGGRISGVMTVNPKWAFATQESAQKFVRDNGGKVSSWDEVLTTAIKEASQ